MSIESNKVVVRSFFERALNHGDLEWLDQIIAPSFGVDASDTHRPGHTGPDRARHMVLHYRQAFPDIQFTVEDILIDGCRKSRYVSQTCRFLIGPQTSC